MIRGAQLEDIDKLVVLAEKFLAESPYDFAFDELKVRILLEHMVVEDNYVIQVLTVDDEVCGAIGVSIAPFMFSQELVGQEMFWFVDKEHRQGRSGFLLLRRMECTLGAMGIGSLIMTSLANYNNFDTFFDKIGYTKHEHSYLKRI